MSMTAVFAILLLCPDGFTQKPNAWVYAVREDAIAATKSDAFGLFGEWVGVRPSFPYRDAVPLLNIVCSGGAMEFVAINANAMLESGTWPIEYRVDDVQGSFGQSLRVSPGGKIAFMKNEDFAKILKSRVVILRVRGADYPLAIRFQMPTDIALIESKCGLH